MAGAPTSLGEYRTTAGLGRWPSRCTVLLPLSLVALSLAIRAALVFATADEEGMWVPRDPSVIYDKLYTRCSPYLFGAPSRVGKSGPGPEQHGGARAAHRELDRGSHGAPSPRFFCRGRAGMLAAAAHQSEAAVLPRCCPSAVAGWGAGLLALALAFTGSGNAFVQRQPPAFNLVLVLFARGTLGACVSLLLVEMLRGRCAPRGASPPPSPRPEEPAAAEASEQRRLLGADRCVRLACFLSSGFWTPFARLSYSAYLLQFNARRPGGKRVGRP